jgi:hypothetical protein
MQHFSRRTLLRSCCAAALSVSSEHGRGLAQTDRRSVKAGVVQPVSALNHPRGQYRFLLGISAYSGGVVAARGYEIVHATFGQPFPLEAGFRAVDEHLASLKLPKYALCALELRSPRALSSEKFGTFNGRYAAQRSSRNILLADGRNPIARTNVSPELFPPHETAIYAFSYVVRGAPPRPTFVVAGGGELPDGSVNPNDIIRHGDTSPGAIAKKARYVLGRMTSRLNGMGVSWKKVTAINVYTAQELDRELSAELLRLASHNTFS